MSFEFTVLPDERFIGTTRGVVNHFVRHRRGRLCATDRFE